MEFELAKDKYLQAWGALGSSWGINRTMAQIHALLLVAVQPLSAEDVMAELQISRGNVNQNLRALMDWGLVKKELIAGERKEFFVAKKDMWEVARNVARERRKREIAPLLEVLEELKGVNGASEKEQEFKRMINELTDFSEKMDGMLDKFVRSDQNWFYMSALKLLK